MTRRSFLALPITLIGVTPAHAESLHVKGRLVEDTSDLQPGYFSLCGTGTGTCGARDAIAISVHPDNSIYIGSLQALVGKDVQLSIF